MNEQEMIDFTEPQIKVMEAIFDLCEAIGPGMTTTDILNVMRAAVAGGQEMMTIQLTMAVAAASMLAEERKPSVSLTPSAPP